MRVLFLPKYPVSGASSRYRVYQFLPALQREGILARVSPFYSERHFALSMQSGKSLTKISYMAIAMLRRLLALFVLHRYDLVYFQREATPFGPLVLERWARRIGVPTVLDLDDALFIFKANRRGGWLNRFKNPDRVSRIIALVDCVAAGNSYIAEEAEQRGGKAVNIPGAEATERYDVEPIGVEPERFTLGWIGSPSTEYYLDAIKRDLQRMAEAIDGFRFVIIGGRDFECDGVDVVHTPWTLEHETAHVRAFDVGIMPLPDDKWSRGKCGGKGRIYMAAGVVPVLTGIGYNCELVEHGRTGMLVPPGESWFDPVVELYRDASLRNAMANAARAHVAAKLSVEAVTPQMAELIRSTAASGAGRSKQAKAP